MLEAKWLLLCMLCAHMVLYLANYIRWLAQRGRLLAQKGRDLLWNCKILFDIVARVNWNLSRNCKTWSGSVLEVQNSIFLYNCNPTCADISIPIIAKRSGVIWVPLGYIMGRVGPSVLALGSDSAVPDLCLIWSPLSAYRLINPFFIFSVRMQVRTCVQCDG